MELFAYGIIMYVGFIFVGKYIWVYAVGSAPVIELSLQLQVIKMNLKIFQRGSLTIIIVSSVVMTLIAGNYCRLSCRNICKL